MRRISSRWNSVLTFLWTHYTRTPHFKSIDGIYLRDVTFVKHCLMQRNLWTDFFLSHRTQKDRPNYHKLNSVGHIKSTVGWEHPTNTVIHTLDIKSLLRFLCVCVFRRECEHISPVSRLQDKETGKFRSNYVYLSDC